MSSSSQWTKLWYVLNSFNYCYWSNSCIIVVEAVVVVSVVVSVVVRKIVAVVLFVIVLNYCFNVF